jgi:two-component system sensor histidine kinase GlrK
MSVSRRVILSVAVLMLLALGVLGYQLWTVMQIQHINNELSNVTFEVAQRLVQMQQDASEIYILSQKYVGVRGSDPRASYQQALQGRIKNFDDGLRKVEGSLRPAGLNDELANLSTAWIAYRSQMNAAYQLPPNVVLDELPRPVEDAMNELQARTQAAYEAVRTTIQLQVKRNASMGDRAQTISLIAAAVFVVLGLSVTYWTLRSITTPLHQLTRGTRTIANGEFSHRLPVDGPLEFAELARDFNSMSEKLGELDQMKKDFVAHVSHELKAPLAAIRQTLAVTLEQVPGTINDAQRRLLQLSRNSAERLSAIVANLLDVSRLEAGTMEYEMGAQDIVGIVRQVVDEFSLKAQERRIGISVKSDAPGIPVVCDGDRMIQVIGNLVDNALKFSPTDSTINIDVTYQNSKSAPMATVSIGDRGNGVPDDHKLNVFQKFHQVKGRGKRTAGQGVGLGLAICKTIMDAHRGRIWVEDNPGGGSVFRIEMHAAPLSVSKEAAKCV